MEHASLTRSAVQATLHCLTGCAIGEVLGMVVATALGWGNLASIVVSRERPWRMVQTRVD